jgi:mitochondrial chaperone BCS1
MLDSLIRSLNAQLQNQVISGGLLLGFVGLFIAWARNLPATIWNYAKRLIIATAVIDNRNDLFNALIAWLNELPFGRNSRFFTVIQQVGGHADEARDDGLPRLLFSPAPGFHLFWHAGRPMWIHREISMNLLVIETLKINVLFASRRYLENLLDDVLKRAYGRYVDHTLLFTVDASADKWRQVDARPRRRIESVVLDGDIRNLLLHDVQNFFAKRAWYAELGIPWRRGYLLHGPPGTGKTSLVYAVAGELRLNLCSLSLTNPKLTDQTISGLLQKTPARSLILIEDVDAFFTARQKQDNRIAVSFSGLLNALDGVAAQEGRIVFLTTNHEELLDAALIRPGRIDVTYGLELASREQVRALFLRFHPNALTEAEHLTDVLPERTISPAQIQQTLLMHPEPQQAAEAIIAQGAAAIVAASRENPDTGHR